MLKSPSKLSSILVVLILMFSAGMAKASNVKADDEIQLAGEVIEKCAPGFESDECLNAKSKLRNFVNASNNQTLAQTSAIGVAFFSVVLTGWILWRAKANGAANNNDASGLRVLDWSLAKALSDTHEIKKYNEYTKQEEVVETVLLASSSRTIAFVGLLVMLTFYIGVACVAIYKFALTGLFPTNLDETLNFLAAGLALFVPYGVNKFSGIMKQPKIAKPIE